MTHHDDGDRRRRFCSPSASHPPPSSPRYRLRSRPGSSSPKLRFLTSHRRWVQQLRDMAPRAGEEDQALGRRRRQRHQSLPLAERPPPPPSPWRPARSRVRATTTANQIHSPGGGRSFSFAPPIIEGATHQQAAAVSRELERPFSSRPLSWSQKWS